MSLAGLIPGNRVSNLDHNQFRRVANALLIVEATVHKVSLTALDLSCRDNDRDAGVDARVQWPIGLGHDVLKDGEIVLQYKSGKLSLADVGKEFRKKGVQQTLRMGGSYILLVGHDYVGSRVVRIIVGFFATEHFVPIQSDEIMQVLRSATQKDPQAAWQIVGGAMLKDDDVTMRLVVSLTKWYGELIPTDTLIAWAKNNMPRGPWIVSRIIAVSQTPLPERARALLLNFPHDAQIKSQILANLQTGVSVGPLSNRVSGDLSIVNGWAKDPSPQIRSWAKRVATEIEARLRQQQRFEEEEEM